jgi:UDP-3-O-[3-hydroxymyristoyl] glucosamine N-acyltransferase
MHIQELARRLGGVVDAAADVEISGVATIEEARAGEVTFLSNPRYAGRLAASEASAVFVTPRVSEPMAPIPIRIDNPYLAFARAISLFHEPPRPSPGVHSTAVLGEGVALGPGVSVGAYAVLGRNVRLGRGTVIHPHVSIYEGAVLGEECVVHSHASVREFVRLGDRVILQNGAVVGADGFGFAPRADRSWEKIPQAGIVVLGDDVEVQANACVDRSSVGRTVIGRGTKLDNLSQVGHGCQVGEDTLLCGQVGLAGSSKVGHRVTLAGQVGVAGHLTIGDDVTVGAQAGVPNSLDGPGAYLGTPALPIEEFRRVLFYWARLPELARRLKAVERRLGDDGSA